MSKVVSKQTPIPVIDFFAGPGGLGEGFSRAGGGRAFRIALSVEMDRDAHQTLQLRAFRRAVERRLGGRGRSEFDRHVASSEFDRLYLKYPGDWELAQKEAMCAVLGEDNEEVAARVAEALAGTERGRPWVLIGGPPCQAYSLAGRARNSRAKRNGDYRPEDDLRHYLYRQYLEYISKYRPAAFVMENVKGMLSAKLNGESMFTRIIDDLRGWDPEAGKYAYDIHAIAPDREVGDGKLEPADFIVRAERYGVPQRRHRVIIVGTRSDLNLDGARLRLNAVDSNMTTCRAAISDLPRLRSGVSRGDDSAQAFCGALAAANWRKLIGAPRRGRLAAEFQLLHGKLLRATTAACVNARKCSRSESVVCAKAKHKMSKELAAWYECGQCKFVFNHETRGHRIDDLHRYMYAAVWAELNQESPTLDKFPRLLLPNHRNVSKSIESGSLFADRFRVQLSNLPSTTVTSHISRDGHAYIHYDASQCRSLTVREAARLQTFPDSYFFCGPRTSQFKQVGNAVPPYLAFQLANVLAEVLQDVPRAKAETSGKGDASLRESPRGSRS